MYFIFFGINFCHFLVYKVIPKQLATYQGSGLFSASDLLLGDHVCEKCDAVKWIDCP